MTAPKYPTTRVCGVCKKFLGYANDTADEPNIITHGHCPKDSDCTINYMKEQMDEFERSK